MHLFSKKGRAGSTIPPACTYCIYGQPSSASCQILCEKNGIVMPEYHCRHYRYDPLARIPKRPPQLPVFTEDDFSLE